MDAQQEAMKEENIEYEALFGAEHKLETWSDKVKYLKGRAWIPKIKNLRNVVMDEAHRSRYLIHPGADKMYKDVMEYYWWPGIKKDISLYVGECLTCAKSRQNIRSSPVCWNTRKSNVEMGTNHDGFCDEVAQDDKST